MNATCGDKKAVERKVRFAFWQSAPDLAEFARVRQSEFKRIGFAIMHGQKGIGHLLPFKCGDALVDGRAHKAARPIEGEFDSGRSGFRVYAHGIIGLAAIVRAFRNAELVTDKAARQGSKNVSGHMQTPQFR